ncbi:MAG: DASH family cryptochrome [Porticoccaceae bacterium]|nr:DASH family cryptochrome [Porticoccaceae bacterium]
MKKTGIILFRNDLRLSDNATLTAACAEVDRLICIYCREPVSASSALHGPQKLSDHRERFLFESLTALDQELKGFGQHLLVVNRPMVDTIAELITQYDVTHVYSSVNAGWFENHQWSVLRSRYSSITFHQQHTHTLFDPHELPFEIEDLPSSFSKFRRVVEKNIRVSPITDNVTKMPPSPIANREHYQASLYDKLTTPLFIGGEKAGRHHVETYFDSDLPSTYKNTRNGLEGMDYSTKFSPWLSNGSLSAKTIVSKLIEYETLKVANESTYWIYFELLWREYFQWYAHHHGNTVFRFKGLRPKIPNTSFYAERYQKWCQGNTPFALVNAFMKQLVATGYMSNRGRQLVASCFVHELNLDWRYGARFMEQHLIDFDVASNWANWQYLAGVGADPRGHRQFDLKKQAAMHDSKGEFTSKWQGSPMTISLDSVDVADWPL